MALLTLVGQASWPVLKKITLIAVTLGMLHAETGAAIDEYQVKAAFLFNFAKFVEWPATAFKDADEPIRICVLGRDPFGPSLESVVRGKYVGNRGFVIREVLNAPAARQCSILFVGASEQKRTRSILSDLKDTSVLTVGETEDFIPNGGVIAFRLEDARVRVEIDRDAAERAKLRISSKLLSLAQRAKR